MQKPPPRARLVYGDNGATRLAKNVNVSQNGGRGFVSAGTISLTRSVAIGNAANNVYSNGGGIFFSFGDDVIGVGSVTLATPALRRLSGRADIVRRF